MKVTIITAVYNGEKTLEDSIISVLKQRYTNIEYIIVDGNSKDNTVNIIKRYEPEFAGRLKWISEPDQGIYDAMNKGIRMATGEVIGILNSDDFFTSEEIITNVAETFEKNSVDAIYGDIHFVDQNNLEKKGRYYSSAIFSRRKMKIGLMPAHPSFYARNKVFEQFGLYKTDYKIAADFEFLLRTIYKGKIKIKYLPLDMVTMRTGGASTSGFASHKLIMKEHLRAFKENGIYTNVLLLSLRYIYKIYEVLNSKWKKK